MATSKRRHSSRRSKSKSKPTSTTARKSSDQIVLDQDVVSKGEASVAVAEPKAKTTAKTPAKAKTTTTSETKVSKPAKPTKPSAGAAAIDIDASATQLDRVNATLENVERLLAAADGSSNESTNDTPAWTTQLEKSIAGSKQDVLSEITRAAEALEENFVARFEKLETRLTKLGSAASNAASLTTVSDPAATADKEESSVTSDASDADANAGSDWEQRKQQMYAQFGEEYQQPSLDDSPAAKNAAESADTTTEAQDDDLAALHDSIDSIEEVEAEEIGELRAQLTEKLREAEVELSINRAKLDQQTAELERRQVELDRREKSLTKKYSNLSGEDQKRGFLDRLTQHLTLRKDRETL